MISGTAARQVVGVGLADLVGRHAAGLEQPSTSERYLPTQATGLAVISLTNWRRAGLPTAEPRVVMRTIECAGIVDRLEQVGAPDRALDHDRLRRVDRPVQLAPLEVPQLDAHALLGALLPGTGIGIDEVQVARDDTDPLEPECVEHQNPRPVSRPKPYAAHDGESK